VNLAGIKRQALIIIGDVLAKKGFHLSKLYNKGFTHMDREAK